jgi:undecaprenyl-diphosphatase
VTGLVTEIVEWLRPAFSTAGYAIVPVAMFLESAAFLGVLVPGDVILAVAGVYAARGEMAVPLVVALGVLGATAGEITGYWIGRRFGESLIARLPFSQRIARRLDRARASLRRNAGKTIVIGRFATGIAGTVPFAAGTAGVPFRTFLAFTVPSVVVWATAVVLLGVLVGNSIETIDRILSTFGLAVLGAIGLAFLARWGWRRLRKSRAAS